MEITTNNNNNNRWIESLFYFMNKIVGEHHKKAIIIVLSRKMHKLLKWYNETNDSNVGKTITELGIFNRAKTILISEHAIPFVLNKCNPTLYEVLVIDDLIINGQFIDSVCESVLYSSGIFPHVLARAKTDKDTKFLFANELPMDILSESDIPLFTADSSLKALSLNSPIDLEYTILNYKLTNSDHATTIRNSLLKKVKEVFKEDCFFVYKNIHKDYSHDYSNISICINNNNIYYHHNNDFNKIRIFISDTYLKVVSYAPNIIYENQLDGYFANTIFDNLWTNLCTKIDSLPSSSKQFNLDFLNSILKEEYEYRKLSTKIILANYISSFYNVLVLKSHIDALLVYLDINTITDNILDIDDLYLLFGPDISNDIRFELNMIYSTVNTSSWKIRNVDYKVISSSLIPEKFKTEYNSNILIKLYYSNNIRESLSHIFTNMHYNIGLPGRESYNYLTRYKFGECYNSLIETLITHSNIDRNIDIALEIHKWIDEKIDLGIVVAKYERNIDSIGQVYWKRYFSAGENEDSYIRIARECISILNKLNIIFFTKNEFIDIILSELITLINTSEYKQLFSIQDFIEYSPDCISYVTIAKNLWSYLINAQFFIIYSTNEVSDENKYTINTNEITKKLQIGSILNLK